MIFGLANGSVDAVLVFCDEWLENTVVDGVGAARCAGNHGPHKKQALGQGVERNPEQKLVAEELQDAERTIHNPVHEPFGVVVF